MADHDEYRSPLVGRYAGPSMRARFSARTRISTWRDLWIWLAEAEQALGLDISDAQIAAMKAGRDNINFEKAAEYEARFRHDVMAHVYAFGDAAEDARGVIHLGATSCYVTDNADIVLQRSALRELRATLASAIHALSAFAKKHASTPCLAYTHFQPAQPTTMGKRACLWIQDFVSDLQAFEALDAQFPFLGSKGTTGTQASFLTLFEGDHDKCLALDKKIAELAGFEAPVDVSGQTYPRKWDFTLVSALAGVAVSAARFSNDVRLLSGHRELAEPFASEQIGSSAMAYKQNPMRSERIASLARHVTSLANDASGTAAAQWLERTLDDSAVRRIFIPEAFLGCDAILRLVINIAGGLHVNEAVTAARLAHELPFMATEEVLMRAVKAGGDRQVLHEAIRKHSLAAKERVLAGARENDLVARMKRDDAFANVKDQLDDLLDPRRHVGRAPEQTETYLRDVVEPLLTNYKDVLETQVTLRV